MHAGRGPAGFLDLLAQLTVVGEISRQQFKGETMVLCSGCFCARKHRRFSVMQTDSSFCNLNSLTTILWSWKVWHPMQN